MYARISTFDREPGRLDEALSRGREDILPVMRRQVGFQGFRILVDRARGRMVGISFWDTEDAAKAAAMALDAVRDRSAGELGDITPPTTELFEVVAVA